MAEGNPQKEEGMTPIASELLEALVKRKMNGYELRIWLTIARKTYGWKKKEDRIPYSQIAKITGLQKTHIGRTIRNLIVANMVTKSGLKIGINKFYSQWKELPNMVTETKSGQGKTKSGLKRRPNPAPHKNIKHYTKEDVQHFSFDLKTKYEKLCNICSELSLENCVNPKLYFGAVDQFSKYFITLPEVQACAFWCKEKGFKQLTASRIRNWFMRKKKWDKEKELKKFSEGKDSQNIDPYKRPDYKPPIDIDLTKSDYATH